MKPVYLDHNATTPVAPEVVESMLPYLTGTFGNASSVHQFGRDAKVALENAREQIASFVNCQPAEIYFTSGGTESDNIAVFGLTRQLRRRRNRLAISALEHPAIFQPATQLQDSGEMELDILPVDSVGLLDREALARTVGEKTALVSVMLANNETGVIQDVAGLSSAIRESGALFHTDAVQAVGKIPVDIAELKVDMLSLSAHKIYGPKGIGALFVRQGIKFTPLMYGGAHERKRRPGTENVAAAVGFARALELAHERMADDHQRLWDLSEYFIERAIETIADVHFNGSRTDRLPTTVNLSFAGIDGESVVLNLDMEQIAVSSGSACSSGAIEPSHVITAMGVSPNMARSSVRFSLGRSTTRENLDHVLTVLPPIVQRLREMSPVYGRQ